MGRVYDNPYWTERTPIGSELRKVQGAPGKYSNVYNFTGGEVFFTGSLYGYGAVSINNANAATASLWDGGTVGLEDLATGHIHEIALLSISGSPGAEIQVYKLSDPAR